MKKLLSALLWITLLAGLTFAQNSTNRISDLAWLSGCWGSTDEAKQVTLSEQWMKPDGGMMLGMGRTVESQKAVDWEFMRIEQRGADVYFLARPRSNKDETPFKAIRLTTFEVVFENPDHDFPQRVIYRLTKSGDLAARIEGTKGGQTKAFDYPMKRASCDK
jgi:hypothetical protein